MVSIQSSVILFHIVRPSAEISTNSIKSVMTVGISRVVKISIVCETGGRRGEAQTTVWLSEGSLPRVTARHANPCKMRLLKLDAAARWQAMSQHQKHCATCAMWKRRLHRAEHGPNSSDMNLAGTTLEVFLEIVYHCNLSTNQSFNTEMAGCTSIQIQCNKIKKSVHMTI